MLDYAANGTRRWPIEQLRQCFEATALEQHTTEERLQENCPGVDADEFWHRVYENLKVGRIRLVFVSDHLPDELIRIIEYLNEQMRDTEVLGVELPQYVGDGHQVLDRMIGGTRLAKDTKQTGTQWHEESFLETLAGKASSSAVDAMRSLFEHANKYATKINFGNGASPGVNVYYARNGVPTQVWYATANSAANGNAYLSFYTGTAKSALPPDQFDSLVATLPELDAPLKPKVNAAALVGYDKRQPTISLEDLREITRVHRVVDTSSRHRSFR